MLHFFRIFNTDVKNVFTSVHAYGKYITNIKEIENFVVVFGRYNILSGTITQKEEHFMLTKSVACNYVVVPYNRTYLPKKPKKKSQAKTYWLKPQVLYKQEMC